MSCILKNTKECLNKSCNKAIEKVCGSFSTGIKVKTDGRQIFNIPHNEEGMTFLNLCKKYLNTSRYRLVKRGRGKRPKYSECGYNSFPSLRIRDSEWLAVYPKYKMTKEDRESRARKWKEDTERWQKRSQALEAIKMLESFVS